MLNSILGTSQSVESETKISSHTLRCRAIIERLAAIGVDVDMARLPRPSELDCQQGVDDLLTVIIPVFNECQTVGQVVAEVAAQPLATEIIIVDDCSSDGSQDIAECLCDVPMINVVCKGSNEGKGAAIRTGLEMAKGKFVVFQDADLEYTPNDIPRLLKPLLSDEADVVFGSRFMGESKQGGGWTHRLGNKLLTKAANFFNGTRLSDMETCYKMFRKDLLTDVTLRENRFGVEPELTAKLARRNARFVELPISYQYRSYEQGKKIGLKDLVRAIYCICRYGIRD